MLDVKIALNIILTYERPFHEKNNQQLIRFGESCSNTLVPLLWSELSVEYYFHGHSCKMGLLELTVAIKIMRGHSDEISGKVRTNAIYGRNLIMVPTEKKCSGKNKHVYREEIWMHLIFLAWENIVFEYDIRKSIFLNFLMLVFYTLSFNYFIFSE